MARILRHYLATMLTLIILMIASAMVFAFWNAGRAAAERAESLGRDACRIAGRYKDAIAYYEKVATVPTDDNAHNKRNHERARASIEAIKLFESSNVKNVADGTYRAESIGYEGPVHVEVAVSNQRIDAVRVVQHKEKQFYAAMTDTPAKIISRQSVQGVDATSSATITSEAILNATAKALAKGAK